MHSGLCPTGALGQYHNVLCPEWLSADIIKYELIEHNLSHTTHLCCDVENMPSKNFRNKCYISFQFSITFRWSDEGKKKFHQKFIKLKTVWYTGKNNQPLGPFWDVFNHKLNATNKYINKRYREWFRLLIQIHLWMWSLTCVSFSWFWEWGPIGFFSYTNSIGY